MAIISILQHNIHSGSYGARHDLETGERSKYQCGGYALARLFLIIPVHRRSSCEKRTTLGSIYSLDTTPPDPRTTYGYAVRRTVLYIYDLHTPTFLAGQLPPSLHVKFFGSSPQGFTSNAYDGNYH